MGRAEQRGAHQPFLERGDLEHAPVTVATGALEKN
jgi:hypothetical protein